MSRSGVKKSFLFVCYDRLKDHGLGVENFYLFTYFSTLLLVTVSLFYLSDPYIRSEHITDSACTDQYK